MSETANTAGSTSQTTNTQGAKGTPSSNRMHGQVATETKPSGTTKENNLPGKTDSEVAEPKRYKFEKLKIKGKEIDFEADEDEVKRLIQRGYGSNEAYHEAKRMREEAEQRHAEAMRWQQERESHAKKLQTDPIQAAIEAGATKQQIREIAEKFLLGEIQADEMSPEARRAKELEAEIKRRDELEAKRKKDDEEKTLAQAAAEERKKIVPEMLKFMDAVGVARTASNLSAIANRLKIASQRKTPITVERAVQLQHEDNSEYVRTTVGGQATALNDAYKKNDFDAVTRIGKEIENFVGEDVLVALQRYGIVKWKSRTPNMPNQLADTAKSKAAPTTDESALSEEEKIERRKEHTARLQREWEQKRGAAI